MFSIGLLTICTYQMNLYTGKIGYVLVNKFNYVFELLLSLLGNFIGTFFVGFLVRHTRVSGISQRALDIVNIKL